MNRQATDARIVKRRFMTTKRNIYYQIALELHYADIFGHVVEAVLIERATEGQAETYLRAVKKTLAAVGVECLGERYEE